MVRILGASSRRCLDEPVHAPVPSGQEPAIFGLKVADIRSALQKLSHNAATQSARATGVAAKKRPHRN